jgi:hypothetical protein
MESFTLKTVRKRSNGAVRMAGVFLGVGAVLLLFSILLELQVAAFIGLGLTFWGAVFALTRTGKYVESSLLDGTARSNYSTIDRMMNDLKYSGQGYYIPAYPKDVFLPEYLKSLKEPVVFISETFDGKPSIDELASGKFISAQTRGVFITSPGSGIIGQVEKQLQMDISKINLIELCEILPKCLTETSNLARNAEMTLTPTGANFKATGIIYDSLYAEGKPKSVGVLGCPLVSAVASALAKASGKTVVIKELVTAPGNSVSVVLNFI